MYENYRKTDLDIKMSNMDINPLDILVVGVTGAGKSTTLNAIFQKDIAKVGEGVSPETMHISSYSLNNSLHLWDSAGLGDGIEQDKKHSKNIIDLLYKTYSKNNKQYGHIDMVLVIIDGSTRDMGTNYKLLNEVIVPNFQKSRILVAINQADRGKSGHHWDYRRNLPQPKLQEYHKEQAYSIQKRVKEATGINIIKPVHYSAEYNFNINGLLDLIIDHIPKEKRKLKYE